MIKLLLCPLLATLVWPTSVGGNDLIVHGGRLNHEFCHNDIKNDNHHCHRSNRKENSNNSKKFISIIVITVIHVHQNKEKK